MGQKPPVQNRFFTGVRWLESSGVGLLGPDCQYVRSMPAKLPCGARFFSLRLSYGLLESTPMTLSQVIFGACFCHIFSRSSAYSSFTLSHSASVRSLARGPCISHWAVCLPSG